MMLTINNRLLAMLLAGAASVTVVGAFSTVAPPAATSSTTERQSLIQRLPQSGFICNSPTEVQRVCEACTALENAMSTNTEESSSFPSSLDGTWKLRFTSASPYGLLRSLPEDTTSQVLDNLPEAVRKFFIDDSALLPSDIEQRIDVVGGRIVNCVDLAPWPKESDPIGGALQQALSAIPGPIGETLQGLKDATIRLELDHSFVSNDGSSKSLDLNLEVVRRNLVSAGPELPEFIPKESTYNLPDPIKPTGSFETTYVDNSLRIARGSSWPFTDEVLVFERVGADLNEESTSQTATSVPGPDASSGDEMCELSCEEDGDTPVLICDDDSLTDFMPSD